MRVIPIILVKNGNVVQSFGFRDHPVIGQPKYTLKRLLDYQADEVIILDISSSSNSTSETISRNDLAHQTSGEAGLGALLEENSDWLLYPLAVGGGIRLLSQAARLVKAGADKIVLNSALRENKKLVTACAESFGSQAVIGSIDVVEMGTEFVLWDHKLGVTVGTPDAFLKLLEDAQQLGCGELLINNVSRDGKRNGFNLELLELVSRNVSVPVIGCGGAGRYADFVDAVSTGVSAVSASNFFHSQELSYPKVKKAFGKTSFIRAFSPTSEHIKREKFDLNVNPQEFTEYRLSRAEEMSTSYGRDFVRESQKFSRCSSCLYPLNSATSLAFNREGICTGCARASDFISRERPSKIGVDKLRSILFSPSSTIESAPYDCVVAVSGGKDSYFQTHFVKHVLGLKPLLVTYDANNWTPTGRQNMERMAEVFSVDHTIIAPQPELLAKMNLLGLLIMGDMSWHAHVGIFTSPMKIAVEKGIPFVFYGEHGREDLVGQYRYGDFPEITYRERIEHHARGYEWTHFVGLLGIAEEDLQPWFYPSDVELMESGVRGLHLGSFIDWDSNRQLELVKDKYGFMTSPVKFDRTYRVGSNLDDMHENGLHDWLKYVKFGYGRATDHGSKDIRLGELGRKEALSMAQVYDSTLPGDIKRWLEYAGISEDLLFLIANSFRSAGVWTYEDGAWLHPEGMLDHWTPKLGKTLKLEIEELRARLQGLRE